MHLQGFIQGDVRRRRHLKTTTTTTLCWWSADSVLSLFAVMLKQVRQPENSTYISVKTAQELVSRNQTQSSYFTPVSSEDSHSAGKMLQRQTHLVSSTTWQFPYIWREENNASASIMIMWGAGGRWARGGGANPFTCKLIQHGGGYHRCGDVKSGCFSEHQGRRAFAVH